MTAHRMNRPNWPPSPDNATGVGLGWSAYRKRGNSSYAAIDTEAPLPAISLNMILEPSGTILVTEQINADNLLAKPRLSTIDSTMAHVDDTYLSVDSVHGGRCNYLMVDGHVVSLEPSATVGGEGEVSDSAETHFGMWTIAAGD